MFAWIQKVIALTRMAEWLFFGGAAALFGAFAAFSNKHPVLSGFLLGVGAMLLALALVAWWAGWWMACPKRTCLPRYLVWYRHKFRRISWRFVGLSFTIQGDGPATVPGFYSMMRANGRSIKLTSMKLKFATGRVLDLNIQQNGEPVLGVSELPAGQWVGVGCAIQELQSADSEAPCLEQFFRQYGAFELVVEFDDHQVFRRTFSDYELKRFAYCQVYEMVPPRPFLLQSAPNC